MMWKLGLCLFFLAGCTGKKPILDQRLDNISGLTAENAFYEDDKKNLRFEMIRDAALSFAAQSALHYHYEVLNQLIDQQANSLDRIFNFQPLILDKDIVPPVVLSAQQSIKQLDRAHVVLADHSYQIIKPAYFMTTPLTWRDYLIQHFEEPSIPDRSLLGRDSIEHQIWTRYVQEGWAAGEDQAIGTFKNNLSRLNQDYQGMVCFHRLFQQGLMTAPIISEIESGIAMSMPQYSDRQNFSSSLNPIAAYQQDSSNLVQYNAMNINQRILAIAQEANLNNNYERWHAQLYFNE